MKEDQPDDNEQYDWYDHQPEQQHENDEEPLESFYDFG